MSVAIKSKDLARVLRNAALFADTKDTRTRPILTTVRIEVEKGELYLQATDSFALLRERVACTDVDPGDVGKVGYICLVDAKPMLALLKTDPHQTILAFDDKEGVSVNIISTQATFEYASLGTFPDTDQLVRNLAFDGLAAGPKLGIGLWQMARLAKLETAQGETAKNQSLAGVLQVMDNTHPMLFTVREISVYVMPVRLS